MKQFTVDHMIAAVLAGITLGMILMYRIQKHPDHRAIEQMHPMDAYYAGFEAGCIFMKRKMRRLRR